MITNEQLVKVRQMLAKECADRKIYADALEAVSEVEALATMQGELTKSIEALKAEKVQLDGWCDRASMILTETEEKTNAAKIEAENEAARIINEAQAKAKEIEANANYDVSVVAVKLGKLQDEEQAMIFELSQVEAKIAEANKTLEAIREKIKGI